MDNHKKSNQLYYFKKKGNDTGDYTKYKMLLKKLYPKKFKIQYPNDIIEEEKDENESIIEVKKIEPIEINKIKKYANDIIEENNTEIDLKPYKENKKSNRPIRKEIIKTIYYLDETDDEEEDENKKTNYSNQNKNLKIQKDSDILRNKLKEDEFIELYNKIKESIMMDIEKKLNENKI